MNLDKFEKIINDAFEIKEKINANSDKLIIDLSESGFIFSLVSKASTIIFSNLSKFIYLL